MYGDPALYKAAYLRSQNKNIQAANAELQTIPTGLAEPLDELHPMEYAEVTGLVDELIEEIYPRINW